MIDVHFANIVEDCIAIGQGIDNGTDERVILFIKLSKDQELSPTLIDAIRAQIRHKRTPRHVPSKVSELSCGSNHALNFRRQFIQVHDIPYTLNGKRVEVLVKKVCRTASKFNLLTTIKDYQRCSSFDHQPRHAS